jgi:hypothetical protein
MNSKSYSLQEIANWQLLPSADGVAIPRLQRGLVWKAVKMELLWDSIMRGIPIGAFVVCNRKKLPEQVRGSDVQANEYLLDGQQRSAAITMAFHEFPATKVDSNLPILWLDVAPKEQVNRAQAGKSREFWFKVTTKAHPWGYAYKPREVDGKDTVFSAWVQRESVKPLKEHGYAGYRPSPSELWPKESTCPVPFTFLCRAYQTLRTTIGRHLESKDGPAFWAKVSALVENAPKSNWRDMMWPTIRQPEEHKLTKFLVGLRCAFTYEIVALHTPDALMEEASSTDAEGAGVSVLFERINTMGEPPDPEELTYSVLKALWPQLYDIDEVARGRMFPYRLAVLAIQVFTIHEGGKWDQAVNTPYLRSLMRNSETDEHGQTVKQRIEAFIRSGDTNSVSPFAQACAIVDEWLGFARTHERDYREDAQWGFLKFHRTAIAQQRPVVYKLLLLLALQPEVIRQAACSQNQMASLTAILSWFTDKPSDVAERLYKAVSGSPQVWKEAMRKALVECVDLGLVVLPCPPKEIPRILDYDDVALHIENMPRRARMSVWWPSLSRMWSPFGGNGIGHETLLYAQRCYLKVQHLFGDYDPSQRDMWETYNRPWDLDHILPRSWLCRRQGHTPGKYMEVGEFFRDCSGNVVAIPFSANRAKKDEKPDSSYCEGYDDQLHLNRSEICQYKKMYTYDEEQQRHDLEQFVCTTRERFIKLYNDCYVNLDLGGWFSSANEQSQLRAERGHLVESLRKALDKITGIVVHAKVYRDGVLVRVDTWDDAWFCDAMYFTAEYEGQPQSIVPFLSHERSGGASRAYFVGLLNPSIEHQAMASVIADKSKLDRHQDATHWAYSLLITEREAIDGLVHLLGLLSPAAN